MAEKHGPAIEINRGRWIDFCSGDVIESGPLPLPLGYAAMVVLAVALSVWSRSRNLQLASLVVLVDWLLSNFFTTNFGMSAVNFIAPMNVIFFAIFLTLFRAKAFRGNSFYRPLLFFYFVYVLIGLYHLGMRVLYPDTLAATYYFVLASSNVVYILIILTLYLLAILKGIDSRYDGGLMALYNRLSKKSGGRDKK